jgi:hypothetical protein
VARAKGFQGICGRKKGVTWGTAVAVGAGDGIEVLTLVPSGGTAMIEDRQLTGRVSQREASPGLRNVTVTMTTGLRYEGNGRDIAQVMGLAGVPATVDTSGRRHAFKVKDDVDDIFETLAYESIKDVKVEELPSVKWNRIVVRGRAGERVEIEVSGIASDWKDDSAVNTTATIDTVTMPSNREFAQFAQAVLLMNAQGGADFTPATDYLEVASFEITIERALEARFGTGAAAGAADRTLEPIPPADGFFMVSGTFEFPTLRDGVGGNAAFLAEQMALTRKKATLTITSPNLAGSATEFFKHKLWLPNLQFGEAKVGIPGPGGPTWSIPFKAWHVTTIPTGFTAGYVDALTWENVNQDAVDPLA